MAATNRPANRDREIVERVVLYLTCESNQRFPDLEIAALNYAADRLEEELAVDDGSVDFLPSLKKEKVK